MNIPTTTFVQQAPNQKDEGLYRVWFNQIGSFINGAQSVKENKIMNGTNEIGTSVSVRIGAVVVVCGVLNVAPGVTYSGIELLPVAPQLRTQIHLSKDITATVLAGEYTGSFVNDLSMVLCFNVCYIAESKKR